MPRVKTISDEAVLDEALEVLLDGGPQGFTLPAVGRAVGLSPSTLVQRFGSKQGLIEAVLARSTEQLEAGLAEPTGDLVDWLVSLARPMNTRARLAGSLAMLVDDVADPKRAALARRHMDAIRTGIASFRDGDGVEAAMIEAHWHGLIIQWALSGEGELEGWLRAGLERLIGLSAESHQRSAFSGQLK